MGSLIKVHVQWLCQERILVRTICLLFLVLTKVIHNKLLWFLLLHSVTGYTYYISHHFLIGSSCLLTELDMYICNRRQYCMHYYTTIKEIKHPKWNIHSQISKFKKLLVHKQFRKNDIESKQFPVKSGTLTLIYSWFTTQNER